VRLLLCIPYFAPAYAFGGSVTVAETVVDGFVAAGHDVTVATTNVLNETDRVALDAPGVPGATVVRFANVSHRAAAGANVYLPRGYRRWLTRNMAGFDVVLLQDLYSAVSVLGARAAARADVPYALQPLGTLSPAPERGRSRAKLAFLRLWGDRTIAEAAALVYSTDAERREFLDVGAPARTLVRLPLPLDLPVEQGDARAATPTIAFVGRLHPIKRIDILIEAVALARRDVPELRLEIVGPGERHGRELADHAQRLGISDAVRFHGFVSVDEKFRILREAHLGALLSAGEGLPMGALETMACGTPMVLSEGCHLPEIDGVAGMVVPGDARRAAAAIVALLSDEPRRAELGAGAEAFARAFQREVVMPQMVAAFAALATRRGG
jgi:glycosyltransferase involved in cell wall biosynthesis